MTNQSTTLDLLFRAMADPTRRAVLERLGRGKAPVGELARPFKMALPSFMQHLDVLEQSGLIHSTKLGRVRTCELNGTRLSEAEGWLAKQRRIWERRLDQLDAHLIDMKKLHVAKKRRNR